MRVNGVLDMLTPVTIPDLGTAKHELRISAWFVEPGAEIEEGDRLFEVLISGVTCDVSARCAGRLDRIEKDLDAVVELGEVVAWIDG